MLLSIVILGIIQGITEFLPVSSSAHLIIFRDLFLLGQNVIDKNITTAFDVALHLGTALAILIYFFPDLKKIVSGALKNQKEEKNLLFYIIVATIPAGVFGVLFDDIFENFFRKQFLIIALALIIVGIIIYYLDKKKPNQREIKDMTLKDALIIGFSQVFALIPGFSRSGTTIGAGRFLKLKRDEAAKFSFFLSLPVVIGALSFYILKNGFKVITGNLLVFSIGVVTSFTIGLFTIRYLLKYLKKNDFFLFMIYRIILGIFVILYLIFRH